MPKLVLWLVALLAVGGSAAGASAYLLTRGDETSPSSVVQASPTPTPSPTMTDASPEASPSRPLADAPPDGSAPETTAEVPSPAAALGQAPKGCGPSELAYVDPDGRFAFCYPSDMELVTVDTGDGMMAAHAAHPISQTDNRVTVSFGVRVEPYAPCGIDSMDIVMNERVQDFVFAGRRVQACFRDHYDRADSDVLLRKTIDFAVSSLEGKSIIVFVSLSGPEFERDGVPVGETASRIMESAAIY